MYLSVRFTTQLSLRESSLDQGGLNVESSQ
jgi:hypothetical protein